MGAEQASPSRPLTLYDVAAVAGVSHSTVSRVVNGHGETSEATRRRVLEAVDRMGYRPNISARILAGSVRPQIGILLTGGPGSPNALPLVESISRAARRLGYAAALFGVDAGDEGALRSEVERVGELGMAGTLLVVGDELRAATSGPLAPRAPTVALARGAVDGLPTVHIDPSAAAELAVGHLASLGHRRILHVRGSMGSVGDTEWSAALDEAAKERRLTFSVVRSGSTSRAGYLLGSHAESMGECTAVLAPNPSFALGLIHALQARSIAVPEQVSVVSLEDCADAAHFSPPVTAVDGGRGELAVRAMESLHALISGTRPLPGAAVAPVLTVRRSTCAARVG